MGSKDHSFDVVSEVNMQEADNAVQNAKKELSTRFDFKGSMSTIDLDKAEKKITLKTENDMRLRALVDMLQTKWVKRNISIKALEFEKVESGFIGGSLQQIVKIQSGIPSDKAKEIVKSIKEAKIKVQAAIEGDQVRVKAPKIDDLQTTIAHLRQRDFGVELQFVNFR